MNYKTILVDDDHVILFLHNKICKGSNFDKNAIKLESGQKFLDYLTTFDNKKEALIVFLDINMPGLNAWDVLDQMKNDGYSENIHVILVTSSVDNSDKEKAKSYDRIIDFIEKPMRMDQLEALKKHKSLQYLF